MPIHLDKLHRRTRWYSVPDHYMALRTTFEDAHVVEAIGLTAELGTTTAIKVTADGQTTLVNEALERAYQSGWQAALVQLKRLSEPLAEPIKEQPKAWSYIQPEPLPTDQHP